MNAEFDKMLNAVLVDRATRRIEAGLRELAEKSYRIALEGAAAALLWKKLSQAIFYAEIEKKMASAKKIARFMFGGFSK